MAVCKHYGITQGPFSLREEKGQVPIRLNGLLFYDTCF